MNRQGLGIALSSLLLCLGVYGFTAETAVGQETITGETLDPADYGPGFIEGPVEVTARDRFMPRPLDRTRGGAQGRWVVPSRRSTEATHAGDHYIMNKHGDRRMSIAFPRNADVQGAFIRAQGAAAPAIRVLGYRDGKVVDQTGWFEQIGDSPAWFEMNLRDVDRVEIMALPAANGAAWYGLDDLTYTLRTDDPTQTEKRVVLDFNDLDYRTDLTESNYAGLTWELGAAEYETDDAIHAPAAPPTQDDDASRAPLTPVVASGTRAVQPILLSSFQGVIRGDAGSTSYPPDTMGAIGPDHYVITVNRNFAVYRKDNHNRIVNWTLGAFLPGSSGDPRVLFDQHSGRWIVIVPDFDTRIYVAVSLTDNPAGSWFKTSFVVSQGSDSGCWPDYPTLGVDQYGIYTATYMVGCGMTIFAIDKAPLIDSSPYLGTVTAFRNLPWEGAIQPAHTYGNPGGEYLVSVYDWNDLRIRRINPPLTSPTLTELGTVDVPYFTEASDAPALGSSTPLDTVGDRLMMAVYRAGSLWTCHTIDVNGRAGCRWYEIDPANTSLIQAGNVADSSLYYYFPSIMVNQYGGAVMGFTGSNSSQYASCYYTGRIATDPSGEMASPVMYKAGSGAQNNIDYYGRNRWGDYSYTTLDPDGEQNFFTIQEYGHANNIWGTYVAELTLGDGDCNNNGVPDMEDIAGGTSEDCNNNLVPDECDIDRGVSEDCNLNGIPDECDVAEGTSLDCNNDDIPDECELADNDCNGNGIPDDCDITAGTALDCNANGVPDSCDIAAGTSTDCNANNVPDSCDLVGGTSADCNYNGIPDECDLAGGTSEDCNNNGNPDECDLLSTFVASSGELTPIGHEYPQSYTITSAPQPFGEVTFDYEIYADVNFGSEVVNVYIDGNFVDEIFNNDVVTSDCPAYGSDTDQTILTQADFAAYAADGVVDIDFVTSSNVAPFDCEPYTWISVTVSYDAESASGDCNDNGRPDECDLADCAGDPACDDCNNNGVLDGCDIADGTSQDTNGDGIPDECDGPGEWCLGDLNCSGGPPDFADIMYFVAALGGQNDWEQYYADNNGGASPPCPWLLADFTGGGVEFSDIMPFSNSVGGACQPYTP